MTRKQKVEKLANLLHGQILYDGVMDHEVRAAEWYMTQLKKESDENLYGWRKFIIDKKPRADLGVNQGMAVVYPMYASIHYPESATRLQQRVSIGHELAHVCLRHEHDTQALSGGSTNTNLITNPIFETEATFLSNLFSLHRSDSPDDVSQAIMGIHPSYNESLLDQG
ncbi:MAG: ImmA/IrrE family metallo-endopeptidase [Defluviitaleaceae bacterium]|nr:ImmA/IrrE family metallo-endopeptidase [Defluviitaleaceae bacterium]